MAVFPTIQEKTVLGVFRLAWKIEETGGTALRPASPDGREFDKLEDFRLLSFRSTE